MSKVKIPKQLFVVRHKPSGVEPPMGFLHEYSPHTATGRKKMQTQFEWAYGANHYGCEVVEENGTWTKRGWSWTYDKNNNNAPYKEDFTEVLAPNHAPVVWDNVPLNGFKIETTVSRYSTSNKLWRVIDPRGVVFEVSTDNFEKIVMNGTIIRGEIQDKCVWVGNKNLALAE